jgi:hypothetical protein
LAGISLWYIFSTKPIIITLTVVLWQQKIER